MALSESALKSSLLSLFNQMKQAETSEEEFAEKLAKIINDHIKTALVTVNAGIPVTTAGSAAAQTGAATAAGSGSLS
jgi:methionine synthase II (cobalamin-independent)